MKNSKIKIITMTALFTALVTIGTVVIQIPVPGKGYTHFGDSMIYLAACILPAPAACFASGAGAALADLLTGYAIYAPATFIIKILNTLPFVLARIHMKKKNTDDRILTPQTVLMLVPTSFVTIFGYLIAEYIMFGSKFAVVSAITGGWLQPTGSLLAFLVIAAALDKIKFKSKILNQL